MEGNKHYITVDETGRILSGWSDGPNPERSTTGAVLLREDGGYQFRLFEGGEENPCLTDETGAHRYRYENGAVRESTGVELAAERAELEANTPPAPPTVQQQLNDQIETDVDLDYRVSMLELGL